jgi:hypothetical protein
MGIELEPFSGLDVKASGLLRLETGPRVDEKGLGLPRAPAIGTVMPTLMRFVFTLVVLAALFGAAVYALGTFVQPNTRQMTIRIPSSRLEPTPLPPMPAPSPPATAVENTAAGTAAQ